VCCSVLQCVQLQICVQKSDEEKVGMAAGAGSEVTATAAVACVSVLAAVATSVACVSVVVVVARE